MSRRHARGRPEHVAEAARVSPVQTLLFATAWYELHQDGSTTKYYAAMGQTIAVRQTPAGGGQGTLLYPLHDHLGSTVAMLDGSGNIAGTASFWPYGAVRNATGVLGAVPPATVPSGTDKLYTGQRMQAGDTALGLYNYNARFYSTALGAFVSADSVPDGLNRYGYVHDNPLRYTDPTGLDAAIACGTGQRCAEGDLHGGFQGYRQWMIQYWQQHEHIFGGMEDYAFDMLAYVLSKGWSYSQTLAAFHVAIFDTTQSLNDDKKLVSAERLNPFYGDGLEHWENEFWNEIVPSAVQRPIDTLIGYSAGGSVVERILARANKHNYHFDAAIIIQPGSNFRYAGSSHSAFYTGVNASDVPGTRVLTLNEDGSPVWGTVGGALNFQTSDMCGGDHCTEQGMAGFAIWASMQPLGLSGDQRIAGHLPMDVRMDYGG